MISLRLKTITDYVCKSDKVVDVGCDHALLSIYLKKNELCKFVIASDVNQNALNNAVTNIRKYHVDIPTVLSDGLKSIDMKLVDTIVISGMGTKTILSILSSADLNGISKIILSSNNNYYALRKGLNNLGYYLQSEKIVLDHKKYYPIMCFIKSFTKNKFIDCLTGISNNIDYYNFLITKNKVILSKIPKYKIVYRIKLKLKNKLYEFRIKLMKKSR